MRCGGGRGDGEVRTLTDSSQPQAPTAPGYTNKSGDAPPVDPTRNVLDKVDDAVRRQDDLRKADAKLTTTELEGLRLLVEARFDGVNREFALIESRRIEQKNDTKTAVDAALSAAERAVREQAAASEKAIIKSETGVAASSLQQAQTFSAQLKGVETTLSDTKDRIAKLETQKATKDDSRSGVRLDVGMAVAIIGLLVAIAVVFMGSAK